MYKNFAKVYPFKPSLHPAFGYHAPFCYLAVAYKRLSNMMNRFLLRFGVLVGVTLGLWMCSKEPEAELKPGDRSDSLPRIK